MKVQPSYNADRMVLGEILPLNTPFSVIIDTSEICNFRCTYCFRADNDKRVWSYAADNDLMASGIFDAVVRQLGAFPDKLKSVSLSGHGEPLIHRDLARMAAIVREAGVAERIDIHTNASLLTEESAVELAKSGLTRIIISLQGLDAKSYRRVCDSEIDYDKFYNNLELLYKSKNEDLEIHIKIADKAFVSSRDEDVFHKKFSGIADSIYVEKVVPLWENLKSEPAGSVNKFGYGVGEVKACNILFYKLMVAPNGDVYPCPNLPPPFCLGNVKDITLREAWNSPQRTDFLRLHLLGKRHMNHACSNCFIPINSVLTPMDKIDSYAEQILKRIDEYGEN